MAKKKKPKVPSERGIGRLPYWAQVAFAARCARRVQPLFQAGSPEAPANYVQAIEQAIRVAEMEATAARPMTAVAREAAAAAAAQAAVTTDNASASDAALAAASASRDAASASVARAARAVHGTVAEDHVILAMQGDFERIKATANEEGWTDETPVPPEFFGPLWPEGEPPGWPAIHAKEKVFERGPMSLYFDRSEFSNEQMAEVISLLSELYGAVGGDRLVIRGTTLFVPKRQPVPEGV